MSKIPLTLLSLLIIFVSSGILKADNKEVVETAEEPVCEAVETAEEPPYKVLYEELNLSGEICFQAFEQAMKGYDKVQPANAILTVIDFSKPSTEDRMYVIDLEKKEILIQSVVAHGKRSGENYTTSFSNKPGSSQSSLGFFLTENTYKGRNGLSLVLIGLEKGINDNVKRRGVVIHGANYANKTAAQRSGRLGRSFGCPAVPHSINKEIINVIKNGTLVYAYSEKFNEEYLKSTSIL